MDSPKSDGNAADSEPSFPACSLLSQKSPISKFLSNLSPIDSARTSQYRQRLSESSFPANPSVFGSPHSDLQRDSNFLKRKEIANSSSNGHGQGYSQSSSATKHMVLGSLSLVEDKIWGLPSQNIWNHDHVQSDELLEHHVDQEAFQHQQGIRRHLQFEGIFNGKVDAAFGCHASSDSFSFNENGGNQATPSHIRMGLSNVANSLPVGSIKKLAAYQSSQEKYIAERGSYLKDISDSLISTGREVFDNVDSDSNEAVIVHHGGQLVDKKLPWDPQQALCFERQTLPGDGKISGQQLIERVEESQCQDNSKAKRKKEYMDESDGCKRCNCKRSKCLKLYCECFAAGFYCVDSCACENCYNKPEYEDTVSDVREQIQLRNPLAFAPTVVKQANSSPIVADDPKWTSSSSARHKRGCKCKRSKCLKKYCECYRAKVGCSDGCRCEDCDNYFGKKSESIFGAEKWKNPSHEKLITTEVLSDHVKGRIPNQFSPTWEELVNLSHLTPFSHAHSRAVPSLTSFDMEDISNVSQAQSQEGNGFQLLPGQFHWHSSALTPTLACVRKSPHEFGSTNATYDMFGSPKMLIDNCNSTNTLKAHSPNQKRVSPPQLQSDRLDSSSKPGLQSCRKLNLQAVDSSPLTPYCNSEDCMNQKENDHQGSSHDFECQE